MVSKFGNKNLATRLGLLVVVTFSLSLAQASLLGNGGDVPPSPLTPGGVVVASILNGTITTLSGTTVTYSTWVYEDPNNTFCHDCLDFVYQFTNHGPDVNERYSMSDFQGALVDVGTSPFGHHDPIDINRSNDGPVIGFNYEPNDQIAVGETTPLLVIETNARLWQQGYVSAQDGTAGSGLAFEPLLTPEPSSLGLLGGGLITVAGVLRRSIFGARR
jgi:hypothetical protein